MTYLTLSDRKIIEKMVRCFSCFGLQIFSCSLFLFVYNFVVHSVTFVYAFSLYFSFDFFICVFITDKQDKRQIYKNSCKQTLIKNNKISDR